MDEFRTSVEELRQRFSDRIMASLGIPANLFGAVSVPAPECGETSVFPMTEHEWLTSDQPYVMLCDLNMDALRAQLGGDLHHCCIRSIRRDRLLACAVCRTVWASLNLHERGRIGLAERAADGFISERELRQLYEYGQSLASPRIRDAVNGTCAPAGEFDLPSLCQAMVGGGNYDPTLAEMIREFYGNPFAPRLPDVPPWRTRTVLDLAQAAYDDQYGMVCAQCHGKGRLPYARAPKLPRWEWRSRQVVGPDGEIQERLCLACDGMGRMPGILSPERLAILSDALEEAGCDNEDILMHLRGQTRCPHAANNPAQLISLSGTAMPHEPCQGTGWRPLGSHHYRGCWALDRTLGKE